VAKNIVFCADGTSNGPGEAEEHDRGGNPTNVFKLFLNLAGELSAGMLRSADEQERVLAAPGGGPVHQIAKYLHGVGDSDNFLVKVLGGVGGAGLVTRIVRGYTFISRNYQVGDRLFIVGFSRGAYTARALAGLIAARGLLDARQVDLAANREQAYRLGSAEWFAYRRQALESRSRRDWLNKLQEVAFDLPGFLQAPPKAPRIADVEMEAVVVWDTVGSLGIPAYNLKTDTQLDAFQFADLKLSAKVHNGRHLVAVDERRSNFTPTLWDPEQRIVQVLCPGSHSDVGGGYPMDGNQSGLSDGSLQWVTRELTKLQVVFAATPAVTVRPDACGVSHAPWDEPPWDLLPRGPRSFPGGLVVHQSVLDRLGCGTRLAAGQSPYSPANLNGTYLAGGAVRGGVTVVV
jgi:uncharacterized protein (DUF2235 family)